MAKYDNRKNNDSKKGRNRNNGRSNNARSNDRRPDRNGYGDRTDKSSNNRNVMEHCGKENDPSWYFVNRQLSEDALKIPFGYQAGRIVDPDNPKQYTFNNDNTQYTQNTSVPGILRLYTHICPGYADESNTALNNAAYGVFSYVRKNLSTTASYAPADVMMYILGVDSIFTLYSHLMRIFGTVNCYSNLNYFTPDALLHAYGLSNQGILQLKTSVSNYRARFNQLILKASTIYMPVSFSIIDRHTWLFSNVFSDRESIKAQLYVHVPSVYYQINETAVDTGTAMQPVDGTVIDTVPALLGLFDTLITQYRDSDSMAKIGADMRRAFEDRSPWKLSYCDELFTIAPTYSAEVLNQIHNTVVTGPVVKSLSPTGPSYSDWITQNVDSNSIRYVPWINLGKTADINPDEYPILMDGFLNINNPNPSSQEIAVASRGLVLGTAVTAGDETHVFIDTVASDFVESATFIGYAYTDTDNVRSYNDISLPAYGYNASIDSGSYAYLACWSAFDWAPQIVWVSSVEIEPGEPIIRVYRMWEVDNPAVLDHNTLKLINDNFMMSMWSVPELGAYTPE
nr:putative capsid [Marmot picobirnavirus]